MKVMISVFLFGATALALRILPEKVEMELQVQEEEQELGVGGAKFDLAYRIQDVDSSAETYADYFGGMSAEQRKECMAAMMARTPKEECIKEETYGGESCSKHYTMPNYRLADFIAGRAGARTYMTKVFPKSLAARYWHTTKRWDSDYATLFKLVHEDQSVPKPDKDTVVVHYRGYDVVAWHEDDDLYFKDLAFYEEAAAQAGKTGLRKAVIMAGDHFNMNIKWKQATQEKIDNIQRAFEKEGFQVSQRVDGNPDCDFIFGSNARVFVAGGGGFSKLMQAMVKLNGAIVVKQTYGKPIEEKIEDAEKNLAKDNYQK